jgi:hypothetical protein
MFRSAIFAVLAVALSSSPAMARQLTVATSLAASVEAAVKASTEPGLATATAAESTADAAPSAPRWATALAIAGPLADGLTTVYAMRQSGPNVRVVEGNGFYNKLFGTDVKPAEIMAFKVGQAALMGSFVHFIGKRSHKAAIATAILQTAANFFVASQNVRTARTAGRLNAGAR